MTRRRAIQPIGTLLPEMEDLAQAINGPGMGGTIRGDQLNGLLAHIDDQAADIARLEAIVAKTKAQRAPRGALKAEQDKAQALAEVALVLADIIQSHPELMGSDPLDAINAWCRQATGEDTPLTWLAVFNPDREPWQDALDAAMVEP